MSINGISWKEVETFFDGADLRAAARFGVFDFVIAKVSASSVLWTQYKAKSWRANRHLLRNAKRRIISFLDTHNANYVTRVEQGGY